ncbi:YlxM family DNA-binding protein [Dendrosporobacter sp. 1207_IL3150]|uniref:YlxM family DNA-binding protein n=1 Tax=Dendrosporobacter sp. 1207_IL3150 TaxID=3084054 RepID=UPI002FDAFCE2
MLDKVLKVGMLFDFYGALLTEKQQRCLEMHYSHDLSLSEIAEEFGVSRQAVHDILKRSEQILIEYETKLKLVERYQREQLNIKQAFELVNNLSADIRNIPEIQSVLTKLADLIVESEEV